MPDRTQEDASNSKQTLTDTLKGSLFSRKMGNYFEWRNIGAENRTRERTYLRQVLRLVY